MKNRNVKFSPNFVRDYINLIEHEIRDIWRSNTCETFSLINNKYKIYLLDIY